MTDDSVYVNSRNYKNHQTFLFLYSSIDIFQKEEVKNVAFKNRLIQTLGNHPLFSGSHSYTVPSD